MDGCYLLVGLGWCCRLTESFLIYMDMFYLLLVFVEGVLLSGLVFCGFIKLVDLGFGFVVTCLIRLFDLAYGVLCSRFCLLFGGLALEGIRFV